MDRTDRKLLALLQEDCTLSIAQLAEQVGLSATPCWKRIQRLEAEGVIERRVALVDPDTGRARAHDRSSRSRPGTIRPPGWNGSPKRSAACRR